MIATALTTLGMEINRVNSKREREKEKMETRPASHHSKHGGSPLVNRLVDRVMNHESMSKVEQGIECHLIPDKQAIPAHISILRQLNGQLTVACVVSWSDLSDRRVGASAIAVANGAITWVRRLNSHPERAREREYECEPVSKG